MGGWNGSGWQAINLNRLTKGMLRTTLSCNAVFLTLLCCKLAGDEARGHKRRRVDGLELEDRGGCNGKWSFFCTIGFGYEYPVRDGLKCRPEIRWSH